MYVERKVGFMWRYGWVETRVRNDGVMMFITIFAWVEGGRWVLLKRPRCDIDGVGEGK